MEHAQAENALQSQANYALHEPHIVRTLHAASSASGEGIRGARGPQAEYVLHAQEAVAVHRDLGAVVVFEGDSWHAGGYRAQVLVLVAAGPGREAGEVGDKRTLSQEKETIPPIIPP